MRKTTYIQTQKTSLYAWLKQRIKRICEAPKNLCKRIKDTKYYMRDGRYSLKEAWNNAGKTL